MYTVPLNVPEEKERIQLSSVLTLCAKRLTFHAFHIYNVVVKQTLYFKCCAIQICLFRAKPSTDRHRIVSERKDSEQNKVFKRFFK